jgi:hypothetical protein
MTPEEKALIATALKWQLGRKGGSEEELRRAVQAVRISRRPAEGPEAIPCMVTATYSTEMFCHLPKGHEGSEVETFNGTWGQTYHEGIARNGNGVRRFRVSHELVNGIWERRDVK